MQWQTPGIEWSQTFDRGGDDIAITAVDGSGDGYLFAGQTTSGSGGRDAWVLKTDGSGRETWQKTFGGGAHDWISAATPADSGSLLAGQTASRGNGQLDAWLVKLAADGTEQWQRPYGGTGDDRASSVLSEPGGYVFAGGTKSAGSGGVDAWLMRVDESGDGDWNEVYGGTGDDWAFDHVRTDDGGYLLVGETDSAGSGGRDAWVLATDGDGTAQWNQVYGGSADDYARAVVPAHDDGYVFAGGTKSAGSGGTDGLIVEIDSSGTETWRKRVGGRDDDRFTSLVRHGEGYLAVGSTASTGRGQQSTWVVKLLADGKVVWQTTYETNAVDYANAVVGGDDPLVVGALEQGGTGSARLVKLAGESNTGEPTADFSVTPTPPETSLETKYEGTGSSAANGTIATYEWDTDGDGEFEEVGESATHAYEQVGEVPVTLRLRTDDGGTTETTKTLDVRVARTSALREHAREIDDVTVTDIDHEATVASAVSRLNDRVRTDRLPLETAEGATQRLVLAETFTVDVLSGLGSESYEQSVEEYDLAGHTAELVLSLLVDLAMIGVGIAGGKLGTYIADKLPYLSGYVDDLVGKLDDAIAKLADYAADLSGEASTALKESSDEIAKGAVDKLVEETSGEIAKLALGEYIDEQISAFQSTVADTLRRPIEYTIETDGDKIDDDYDNRLDDGLALAYTRLDPDRLGREGLRGSLTGARTALNDGVMTVTDELRTAHAGLQAIQDTLDEFGLFENLADAYAALMEGDAVETILEILWAIGSLVGDIVSAVYDLLGAGYGVKTMQDVANVHYETVDGIVEGAPQTKR
ncbi:hypothetical protein CP556_01590 [Natrinema sp. CBA1119]|nr:hypothetical protein CP556_01590 [Natrinema sp. CBA1119]